jgi:hypothetical protein
MQDKALNKETQLAIPKWMIDVLDKVDDLEIELDKIERDIYRRIMAYKKNPSRIRKPARIMTSIL